MRVQSILASADLEVTSSKTIRQQLEAEFACNLNSKKAFLSDLINAFINGTSPPHSPRSPPPSSSSPSHPPVPPSPSPPTSDPEESQEELDRRLALELQEESARPRRHAASDSLKKAAKRKAREGGGGGEGAVNGAKKRAKKPPALLNLSPQLSAFFDGETKMGRGDVVRALWVYIKERGLQAEADRRKIVLDDRLKGVFGKDRKTVDMFKMNALLTKHLKKDEELA